MSFRDRFYTPRVARAVTSPGAIVATGAGAAVGILVGLGPIGAVLAGLAGWGLRVLAAVPRRPVTVAVNPRELDQPWRSAVEEIQDARRRFNDAVATMAPGPLRDRLGTVAQRLDTAVEESWRVAKAGNTLAGGRRRIDTDRIRVDLDAARAAGPTARSAETIAALESQLGSAARLEATMADAHDRLRLLDARADEAVTRAVELSVSSSDPDDVLALDGDVAGIVTDLEALRLAVEETHDPTASARRSLPGGGVG